MCFLEFPVVFQQLVKGYRRESIQIDAGIQQIIPRLDAGPEIHVCIRVDMTVNHKGTALVLP